MQRFDPEWEGLVDIDIAQIRDRDKIKVVTTDNSQTSMAGETSTASLDSHDHGVEQLLIQNLQEERTGLDYNLSIAQATLESLKVAPCPGKEVLQGNTLILPAAVAITKDTVLITACCIPVMGTMNVASSHYTRKTEIT